MESLPSEIINEILLLVDRPSLYYVSQVCVQWRQMALKQVTIIVTKDIFRNVCLQGDRLSIVKSKFNKSWLNHGLYGVCEGGHKHLVELVIAKGANKFNNALSYACLGGHKDLVELMITKGADNWKIGFSNACLGGHKDLVELMIAKGADNWNLGLENACYGGYKELVEFMITKGA